jgi:hypothetical protein
LRERLTEQLLRARERTRVHERVRQQDGEARGLDQVLPLLRLVVPTFEERGGTVVLARHRVGAAEAVSESRVVALEPRRELECLLERLDGPVGVAPAERDLSETGERPCALSVADLGAGDGREMLLGGFDVSEPEVELGLGERVGNRRARLVAAREVLDVHADPVRELTEQLQRRDALAGFDPRDVRRRAPWERERTLRETGLDSSLTEPPTDRGGVVDVLIARPPRHGVER